MPSVTSWSHTFRYLVGIVRRPQREQGERVREKVPFRHCRLPLSATCWCQFSVHHRPQLLLPRSWPACCLSARWAWNFINFPRGRRQPIGWTVPRSVEWLNSEVPCKLDDNIQGKSLRHGNSWIYSWSCMIIDGILPIEWYWTCDLQLPNLTTTGPQGTAKAPKIDADLQSFLLCIIDQLQTKSLWDTRGHIQTWLLFQSWEKDRKTRLLRKNK